MLKPFNLNNDQTKSYNKKTPTRPNIEMQVCASENIEDLL